VTLYTFREVAATLRTSVDRVGDLVRVGELLGTDISSPDTKRACWRVSEEALAAFLAARTRRPEPKAERRRRKRGYTPVYY
jgi:hypothetical protein